jgi:tetratricopeptide (TPR) repeat protein
VAGKLTAILRDPEQVLERAQREFERGHMKETIELLELALTMRADSAPVRTMLGLACARTRQVERAFEHLERAVEFDPEAFAPRCALGELYAKLCVPEKAREHLDRALECATTAQERNYVQSLLHEERVRDRRRMYRPNFHLLRRGRKPEDA